MISASISPITAPYTLTGEIVYKSGTRVAVSVSGIYTGTDAHALTVTFYQQNQATGQIEPRSVELEVIPTTSSALAASA